MTDAGNSNAISRVRTALGLCAVVALLWSGYEANALRSLGEALDPSITRLELAVTSSDANAIRRDWDCQASSRERCRDLTPVALQVLARDPRFIAAYVTGLVLLGLWTAWMAGFSRRLAAIVIGPILVAGACDLAGDWLVGITLGSPGSLPFARVAAWAPGFAEYARDPSDGYRHAVTLARVAAMSKLGLLLFGVATTLALAGGEARRILVCRFVSRKAAESAAPDRADVQEVVSTTTGFRRLVELENGGIFGDGVARSADQPVVVDHGAADEPRVDFRTADVIGLALSGGGIRSATFNLGLLQGLHRMRLLKLFDYVASVSGGGYVASFWSEWLARQNTSAGLIPEECLFPTFRDAGSPTQGGVDSDQERHLREFSGFLAPRWGFFEVETWTAIVAMLAGLLPALLIGLSVIGIAIMGWLVLTSALASGSAQAPVPVIVLASAVTLYVCERIWQVFNRESAGHDTSAQPPVDSAGRGQMAYGVVALFALGLVALLQWALPLLYEAQFGGPWPVLRGSTWQQAAGGSGLLRWWVVAGVSDSRSAWTFTPRVFDFGLVWLATALLLVLTRLAYSIWPFSWTRETLAAFDRVLMRVLALGVAWCGVAALWHVSINLHGLIAAASAAILSAGVFATLRNWIGAGLRRPAEAGVVSRLRPYLPQVLAYVTICLAAVAMGALLIRLGGNDWLRWWAAAAGMTGCLVLGLFIKPDEFGLHAFYRDRISRAYAGACNLAEGKHAADNRGTEPLDGDDRVMSELAVRPLHLVCCAANDLSGDQVETLERGARSAVLSKHGFSVGRHFRQWTPTYVPRLGSAITASAAAFNSNMGHVSVLVGPAVSFLMTMLNLRLGLWLRHPAAPAAEPRRWPGLLFYREMFALTSASGRIPEGEEPSAYLRDVHLSDGAHFENLALYELIRRHCRYVLVSDCGADPAVAFDDLGNALRRIREDFGVEISLDVSSLRPGPDGRSRQHVAVGTIHYSPTDRGILLYVKPSLTGDEPPDVLQYKTRNAAFPHEGTGDQFYDEAQWESYRRLGLHAAATAFEFVAHGDGAPRSGTADWVFAEASHHWSPTPPGLGDRVLEMNQRFGALEAEMHQRPTGGLLEDVFPELAFVPADAREAGDPPPTEAAAQSALPLDARARAASEFAMLLRVTQLMEDVWVTCQLDQWWTHPLNLGWINLFARWATSAGFRFWWPLLSPMYSPGFVRFIQTRFPTAPPSGGAAPSMAVPQRGRVEVLANPEASGLAAVWWKKRSAQPANWSAPVDPAFVRVYYQDILDLPRADGAAVPIQVGLLAVTKHADSVGWTSDDFFVPPSLWGAGIGWYFLDSVLVEVRPSAQWCHVVVKMPPAGSRHQVRLDDRRVFVEQYRKMGFREVRWPSPPKDAVVDEALCRTLGFNQAGDTLLVLDLARWSQRRQGAPAAGDCDGAPAEGTAAAAHAATASASDGIGGPHC